MGEITINTSKLNKGYSYKSETLLIGGSYQTDEKTGRLDNVNGNVYRNDHGEQGAYVGQFNGYWRGDEVKYSVTDMSRKDSAMVWDAIDEIEAYILGENENNENE